MLQGLPNFNVQSSHKLPYLGNQIDGFNMDDLIKEKEHKNEEPWVKMASLLVNLIWNKITVGSLKYAHSH